MASLIPATRQRKQRFSEAELTVLVEHIAGNADMLFSTDHQRSTQQRHKEVWAEAAHRCTAVRVTIRTVIDCHKRWDDLQLRVRNLIAAHHQHSTGTGGGPASPLKLQSWEVRCSILHLEGIQGVGEADVGVCPPADAADTSGDSDTAQQAMPRPPARDRCSRPAWDADADTSGTQAPAPARSGTDAPTHVANPVQPPAPARSAPARSGTDVPTHVANLVHPPAPARSGTDAPTHVANPVQPAATQVAPITTVATKSIDLAVCTEEDAASCGDSAPVVQFEDAGQEEVDDMCDLSSLHNLQFSPPDLHSPMRSPTPSIVELSAHMQRMEEQQARRAMA
ncbi:myb-related transcription factor, partner of profilin-like [Ambystoma mexicanum]|uniref:myb-related transcription factor, partner of profilin-like n=1 Tax=Ambystoma mexicanum TaxID=8296 RepID=UPI0037E76094